MTFKEIKEKMFSQELRENKNVRLVYQGKMLKDAEMLNSICK